MKIRERLLYLTERSYQDKLRENLSAKVEDILNKAEAVAKSGKNVYFIEITTPSQEIIDELVSIGLAVYIDGDRATVSWYKPSLERSNS